MNLTFFLTGPIKWTDKYLSYKLNVVKILEHIAKVTKKYLAKIHISRKISNIIFVNNENYQYSNMNCSALRLSLIIKLRLGSYLTFLKVRIPKSSPFLMP